MIENFETYTTIFGEEVKKSALGTKGNFVIALYEENRDLVVKVLFTPLSRAPLVTPGNIASWPVIRRDGMPEAMFEDAVRKGAEAALTAIQESFTQQKIDEGLSD